MYIINFKEQLSCIWIMCLYYVCVFILRLIQACKDWPNFKSWVFSNIYNFITEWIVNNHLLFIVLSWKCYCYVYIIFWLWNNAKTNSANNELLIFNKFFSRCSIFPIQIHRLNPYYLLLLCNRWNKPINQ